MSNELSTRVSVDAIRSISPPRDSNGQLQAVTQSERDASTASRQDVSIRSNDVPSDSRHVKETSDSSLTKSIKDFTEQAQSIQRGLKFKVDSELDKTIITVYDAATEEVIRQIPSEEVLNFARTLNRGDAALIDVKA
jgi:flagellar protein FlaG